MNLSLPPLCWGHVSVVRRLHSVDNVHAGLGNLFVLNLGEAWGCPAIAEVLLEEGGGQDLFDVVQFFIAISRVLETSLIVLQQTHNSFWSV